MELGCDSNHSITTKDSSLDQAFSDFDTDFDEDKLKSFRRTKMSTKCRRSRIFSKKTKTKKTESFVDFVKNPSFTDDANCEIFRKLEASAHRAINSKKIFTVVGGFDVIRQCLLARGWLEKKLDIQANNTVVNEKLISETAGCFETKQIVLSNLIKHSPVYFIWQPKHFDGIPFNINYPLRNRINRLRTSDFTLKEGLHNLAENIQWHIIEDVSELNYPRSFLLMDLYQREYFVQEFRRTLIASFLNFLNDCEEFDRLFSEQAEIPIDLIYNCIQRVENNIKVKQHLCIDLETTNGSAFSDIAKQIDLIVNQRKKIAYPEYRNGFSMEKLKMNIKIAVAEIHVYWPESKFDGHRNIWILKPINKSRGYGVVLMKDIDKILSHVVRHTENKYIIQKYCERPLLIHKTKFDIRQYFLTVITRESINIWSYKDCYIKFSSQEFNLDNLHESIHLTNNSIQRFYANGCRAEALPFHNMWLLKEFKSFLQMMNTEGDIWEEKIYPKIKKNLKAVILASLEDTDLEMNTFELNGADFLIGYDMDPMLIEINANPDLTFTTKTTRDICPRVMEDLVKVIIDYAADQTASTNGFELIYECQIGRYYPPQKIQLNVDGKKILPPVKAPRNFFHIKNFSDLIIQGERLFKPIKSRYKNQRVPMEMKNIKPEKLLVNEEDEVKSSNSIKKNFRRVKPQKIYKSPQRPRNIFKTIVVKPSYSNDITGYVRKLPSVLQSTNRKYVNLNDLMRYLNINENLL